MADTQLSSWKESSTKKAILSFVEQVSAPGSSSYVAPEERIAVFDIDGTLWTEKPMPVQADFMLEQLRSLAEKTPELGRREPYRAALERDYAWFDEAITKHYAGDDGQLRQLLSVLLSAYAGSSAEEFEDAASKFLHRAQHPLTGRDYLRCVYQPMLELLELLEQRGFTTYLVSGGGRDFVRSASEELYGVPRERVLGSSVALSFQERGGATTIVHEPQPGIFDDGAMKPVQIWNTVGRRPIFAVGNANGDIPMLEFCALASRPSLCALVQHDDASREYSYTAGAEAAQRVARERYWLPISMKNDWNSIFSDHAP